VRPELRALVAAAVAAALRRPVAGAPQHATAVAFLLYPIPGPLASVHLLGDDGGKISKGERVDVLSLSFLSIYMLKYILSTSAIAF
jgi:hypothetical protein